MAMRSFSRSTVAVNDNGHSNRKDHTAGQHADHAHEHGRIHVNAASSIQVNTSITTPPRIAHTKEPGLIYPFVVTSMRIGYKDRQHDNVHQATVV